ncbi:MAG: UDP-N-acetylmuramate dehydrogenase [Syntrophothermus sp.]
MIVQRQFSLRKFNTFGLDVHANYFVEVFSEDELDEFLHNADECPLPPLVIGGGSNMLFLGDFPGTILRISTKGIQVVGETDDFVMVKASGGEIWDDLVKFCVDHGWGGLENLSWIPGKVGTAPVQNIGAYGVEIKETLFDLEALNIEDFSKRIFSNSECKFGYRESVFKHELKGKYIILNVTFKLSKHPSIHIDYGNIRDELAKNGITQPGIRDVREAVINIRTRKLPEPSEIGNAGSFFKNPVVTPEKMKELRMKFPAIVAFPQDKNYKIAAAWLIEQCGWKGKRIGDAGVHATQPLVLVNHGSATGKEIYELSQSIRKDVQEKFGIELETEVNIINGQN